MFSITGNRPYKYDIKKSYNIFSPENFDVLGGDTYIRGSVRTVVTDSNLEKIYGNTIREYFDEKNVRLNLHIINSGDEFKNTDEYLKLFSDISSHDIKRRDEPIIAFGGGVITDLVGFVASTYRRGVSHIKVPTSLMGYVDASVGVKTAVNVGCLKNRMGTFEIPEMVLLDRSFLTTLDERNALNGLGEIIKLAVILDKELFELLEILGRTFIKSKFQTDLEEKILDKSILGMINELKDNLFETNLKRKVDFGHTFSLSIEAESGYQVMHCEAVGVDVLFSCLIARNRNVLSAADFDRVVKLYNSLGLCKSSTYMKPELLWSGVLERSMHRGGQQLIPIPKVIGESIFINDLKKEELDHNISEFLDLFPPHDTAFHHV